MQAPVSYLDFFKEAPVHAGDFIYLSSDLRKLIYHCKKHKEHFEPQRFIDALKQKLGPEGTLIIPAFNYSLKNGDAFDVLQTAPITGTLSVEALKNKDFVRTKNPMHSFAVSGKYKDEILALANNSSFGKDSPFHFMYERHCKLISIDVDLQQSLTFAHYAEEAAGVTYRKHKTYGVSYTDAGGHKSTKQFSIFAKKPGYVNQVNPLLADFRQAGILQEFKIGPVSCFALDLHASHAIMLHDLQHNHAGKMTYFSIKVFLRAFIKSMLGK